MGSMDSIQVGAAGQIRWADLLNQYKYHPAAFLSLVSRSEDLRSDIRAAHVAAFQLCRNWPAELRKWEIALMAEMDFEIGSIWSRDLREAAHAELLAKAHEWGVTPTAIRMVSTEIDAVYQKAGEEVVRVPDLKHPPSGTTE